ncbi:UPF0728 protein C10orf53 homolog [Denticeps clupeoides]|uniref:UPF0728 protein C10orf53 homolog n=1 Tax=Denticeps clupeoides TaxID=299321 RepID=UPI0010A40C27|nr:UPF0728 protein C10orf53 homolog [Denticeps clupeoides]
MAPRKLVMIKYGPYASCGVVEHRTFRLEGLQAALEENGHTCVLEMTQDWSKVELVVNGELVYECDINDLEFGGDGRLDCLCQEAVKAVENAY